MYSICIKYKYIYVYTKGVYVYVFKHKVIYVQIATNTVVRQLPMTKIFRLAAVFILLKKIIIN